MTEALGVIAAAPLWMDDAGSISVLEIGAKARRLKRDKGLSLLIVDYLQLITARGRFGNRNEEVSSISRALKGLAKELQIPVLVLSQLTRAPERDDRGPQLSDLRESGAIEQDADVVMFIYRPHFFKAGRHARRARRNRAQNRQAAQRPHRKRQIRLPQPPHPLRRSRPRRLLPIHRRRHLTSTLHRYRASSVNLTCHTIL